MTIRRRCTERNCKDGRRCLEHLRFDVMWRGKRYRMPANEFAIPRKEPGRQRAIQSMEEARDWERLFIGEIKAGRDPQRPPSRSIHVSTELGDVSAFLDAYLERCVRPAALRSFRSVCSQAAMLKEHLGHLPLSALEEPDEINRFKTTSDYAEDVEVASVYRVLETLRAAINWGMAQTPPLFAKSPFHRFGVRLNKKAETVRDRRLSRDEEKRLLDTALQQMNTGAHQFVGELLHDRIIGALELVCRRGEMLLIQNKRVNWDTCQIGIPGATAKDKENRRIPFNPQGRVAAILKRRDTLGRDAYVFGSTTGAYQPTIQTAWETLRLLANGIEPRDRKDGAEWNREQLQRIDLRWHDLRHEGACRLLADGVDIRIIQLMLGHASIQQTQRYLNVTDEELRKGLEVSWNNQGRPLRIVSASRRTLHRPD
jgi:integrase